jgi:hypothetical protein
MFDNGNHTSAVFAVTLGSRSATVKLLVQQTGLISTIDPSGHDVIVAHGNGYTWAVAEGGRIVSTGTIPGNEYDNVEWFTEANRG